LAKASNGENGNKTAVWRKNLSRGHGKNKQFHVWLPEEDFEKVKQFLDKFSAGDSFSEQARQFFHWLGNQTGGIDRTKLVLKLQQTRPAENQTASVPQRSHARLPAPRP
jgi:hypothetical protein